MKSNIVYFVAFCAQLWKKLRNWSVRKKSKSALKFTTKVHRTEFTMEQIIANLLVADNAVIQKVSVILRTKGHQKMCQIFFVESTILLIEIYMLIIGSAMRKAHGLPILF